MEKRRTRKGVKRLPRTTGAGANRASGGKKRLAGALRRNLGKRRDQARQRGGS